MNRRPAEHTRDHRGLRLTPKGLAAACLVTAAQTDGVSVEAAALARTVADLFMDGADAAALLPEVRRLRELLGDHPFGANVDRDALPWFEQQVAGVVH